MKKTHPTKKYITLDEMAPETIFAEYFIAAYQTTATEADRRMFLTALFDVVPFCPQIMTGSKLLNFACDNFQAPNATADALFNKAMLLTQVVRYQPGSWLDAETYIKNTPAILGESRKSALTAVLNAQKFPEIECTGVPIIDGEKILSAFRQKPAPTLAKIAQSLRALAPYN